MELQPCTSHMMHTDTFRNEESRRLLEDELLRDHHAEPHPVHRRMYHFEVALPRPVLLLVLTQLGRDLFLHCCQVSTPSIYPITNQGPIQVFRSRMPEAITPLGSSGEVTYRVKVRSDPT